jgi:hypothetical protein
MKKNKQSHKDVEYHQILIMGVPERKEREKGEEKTVK